MPDLRQAAEVLYDQWSTSGEYEGNDLHDALAHHGVDPSMLKNYPRSMVIEWVISFWKDMQ